MRQIRILGIFVTMLFLNACMVESIPPIQTYTLNYQSTGVHSSVKHCQAKTKIIRLTQINALLPYTSQDIIYSDSPNQLNHYAYSRWSDAPVRLLGKLFQQTLQSAEMFKAVVSGASVSKADYLLESELLEFRQLILDKSHSEVSINMEFRLLDTKTRHVIDVRHIQEHHSVATMNARGAVEALNQASQSVADKLVLWLQENLC
ncbi:ABC-type transport auxiliary lipoprotein family protein [methane-oxidizing endosymbiont of Gigantopelta aegis]|uniref:ABC-type transport auxiliary lipoprotein family protein n=1 Tax=methane-oxidizing endosymbiont of Gigantopelta aegis TaxID=2794938 RepID=UPI0018DCD625|nr:ABC-type transport auxiliary lipoprotein family protein [methane-oxidizing endosymbiont of Gigantopelta aegis]